jgi:hypothetical protein
MPSSVPRLRLLTYMTQCGFQLTASQLIVDLGGWLGDSCCKQPLSVAGLACQLGTKCRYLDHLDTVQVAAVLQCHLLPPSWRYTVVVWPGLNLPSRRSASHQQLLSTGASQLSWSALLRKPSCRYHLLQTTLVTVHALQPFARLAQTR